MITAVDTSVLIAIDQAESFGKAWIEILADAREAGSLRIGEVVAAEFYGSVLDRDYFDAFLDDLGIQLRTASREACCLAGKTFRRYRDDGGPRRHLIPDFLIGAHAQVDCDRLAAADRGYLRRYFSRLPVLRPEG